MESFRHVEQFSARSIEQESLINSLSEKFNKQRSIYQPNPEDFIGMDGYSEAEIKSELVHIAALKEQWKMQNSDIENRHKKISDVFEGIIVDQFCGDWLSNKAEAFFTAEPDDFLRKVDCVVEFKPEEEQDKAEYLGLGIDVTFSGDFQVIDKKLDDVWKYDVERQRQVHIKYVDTEHHKGQLDICRAVLVADKATVFELARLYKHKDQEKLNAHPFLANALLQLKYQLESYLHYAQRNNAKGSYLRAVANTLRTFYRIYEDKEAFLTEHADEVVKTDMFRAIQQYCDEKLVKKKYGSAA